MKNNEKGEKSSREDNNKQAKSDKALGNVIALIHFEKNCLLNFPKTSKTLQSFYGKNPVGVKVVAMQINDFMACRCCAHERRAKEEEKVFAQ